MIGKNIQRIRKKKGLTLSELAERASMSKSYLSNIERNINQNPSIQVMEKISLVLDVELNSLLEMPPEPPVPSENDWLELVTELKESGMEKEQLEEFKTLIQFIKWKNRDAEEKE
ncbi:XRE family transcriptional regulator [Peribacillus cavernae]|uniref:XRE family transcriptional regulator n=2 Tax=Peribacillus cavernae TaxID=1674310 RepID=A0A3S0W1C6_9BACI|nr:helix-turn-helix transcriptional regulator [Peribacillus cavernae]RUQ30601.1 XRE family transcriptional regulator [Peribacillus cavernae]